MSNYRSGDTIAAPATAQGKAGIAVIRLSGQSADLKKVCKSMLHRDSFPEPRLCHYSSIWHAGDGDMIDKGLVTYFPAPHSYTGENILELHIHGGMTLVESTMESLCTISNVRAAEPGEFTRRAFLNDKLDLSQSEAVADMIDAQTRAQSRQALRQLNGVLGRQAEAWRIDILQASALLEAHIDFSDEELPDDGFAAVDALVHQLIRSIDEQLADHQQGEKLREGFVVAIVGPPNVGKSSLLNAIAKRDVAIVHEAAGTTRDVVEVAVDLGGLLVTFVDTAGLRETQDAVELEGIRRAKDRSRNADIVLCLSAYSHDTKYDEKLSVENGGENWRSEILSGQKHLNIINKVDDANTFATMQLDNPELHIVSVKKNFGIGSLLDTIKNMLQGNETDIYAPVITRERHRNALTDCRDALERSLGVPDIENKAEELRWAARNVGQITGRTGVEDMLDQLFREFCIGK